MRLRALRDPFRRTWPVKLLAVLALGALPFGCGLVLGITWDGRKTRDLTMEQAIELFGQAEPGSRRALLWLIQDKCLRGVGAMGSVSEEAGPLAETADVYLGQIAQEVGRYR